MHPCVQVVAQLEWLSRRVRTPQLQAPSGTAAGLQLRMQLLVSKGISAPAPSQALVTKWNWERVPEVIRSPIESAKATLDGWLDAAKDIIEKGHGVTSADVKVISTEIADAKKACSLATSVLATLAKARR